MSVMPVFKQPWVNAWKYQVYVLLQWAWVNTYYITSNRRMIVKEFYKPTSGVNHSIRFGQENHSERINLSVPHI